MISYYGELCTTFYENDKSIAGGKELEFYLSFVDRYDITVLEPMCGNGRMLIPFMQRGINIEGFDISEDMLRVCKEKGRLLHLSPNVYIEKIENFTSTKKYDLIMIPFGSFSLLLNHLVDKSLINMRSALNVKGKLIVTIMLKSQFANLDAVSESEWVESENQHIDNKRIVLYKKSQYDIDQSTLLTKLKYELIKEQKDSENVKVEKTEYMEYPLRLYEINEFRQILLSNGFTNIKLHEVKDGYGEGSSFVVFECSVG